MDQQKPPAQPKTRNFQVAKLEDRIASAPNGICNELSRDYPDGEPEAAACARRAFKDAMAQVKLNHPAVAFQP